MCLTEAAADPTGMSATRVTRTWLNRTPHPELPSYRDAVLDQARRRAQEPARYIPSELQTLQQSPSASGVLGRGRPATCHRTSTAHR